MKKVLVIIFSLICTFSFSQKTKREKIETSFLTYPMISVTNFSLDDIALDFCADQIKLGDKQQIEGTNLCKPKGGKITDSKAIKTYYYNVQFTSPEAFVKISDKNGKVLYMDYLQKAGPSSDNFGKKECYFLPMVLESSWKKYEGSYFNDLNKKVNEELFGKSQAFFKKALFFSYTKKEFKVNYVKDYVDLTKAKDIAIAGYGLINNDAKNADGKNKLNEAISIWNKALEESNPNDKNARINKKVSIDLLENVGIAQLFLMNYDEAKKALKKANDLRPNITTNRTEERKAMYLLANDLQKNYELNKDVPVSMETKEITVNRTNNAGYPNFLAEYKEYAKKTFKEDLAKSKEEYNAGIASGEINPYRDKMVKTATQGYMLTLPNLSGAAITSLADMKTAMQKLEEFPQEICELTELNQLLLSNNNIKSIPPEINKLQNLKKLNVAKNKLTSLPVELGELKNLETLVIKGNSIPQSDIDKIQKMLPQCKIKN